jgi:hypothetical protein
VSAYARTSKNLKDPNELNKKEFGREHGFSAEPVPVSAYIGSSKNLKDLKEYEDVGLIHKAPEHHE